MSRKLDVAILHDFFIDRLVFAGDLESLLRGMKLKAQRGGGGIFGTTQEEIAGGNAVNLAYALARLGNEVLLITHSDKAHRGTLDELFSGLSAEIRVKERDPGLTVAVEGKSHARKKVNLMVKALRGASDFGPELLAEQDWQGLENSRAIAVVNWSANKRGTQLLEAIRGRMGNDTPLFMDPADAEWRAADYSELLDKIREKKLIDWLSVNEGEAAATGRLLGLRTGRKRELCLRLAGRLGIRVDMHTEWASYSASDGRVVGHRTRHTQAETLTGAGDVWDAASIHYFLKGKSDLRRVELADKAAYLFITSADREAPGESDVERA